MRWFSRDRRLSTPCYGVDGKIVSSAFCAVFLCFLWVFSGRRQRRDGVATDVVGRADGSYFILNVLVVLVNVAAAHSFLLLLF